MNWTIIIIEALVLTAAFTAMILIPLVKNPVWWIADYPEDIQEEYFKTHERTYYWFACVCEKTEVAIDGQLLHLWSNGDLEIKRKV